MCAEVSETELFVHRAPAQMEGAAPVTRCEFHTRSIEFLADVAGSQVHGRLPASICKAHAAWPTRKPDHGLAHVVALAKPRAAAMEIERGTADTICLASARMNVDVLSWNVPAHDLPIFVVWRDSVGRFHCKEALIRNLVQACAVG